MNSDKARSVTFQTPTVAASDNTKIIECITDNVASLLGIIRSYVQRMGLARGEEVSAVAIEVLQEVVLEALDHADSFNPSGQPMAWLLGIAINVIKRKKAELARRSRRELSIGEISLAQDEHLNEDELFDQISTGTTAAGPEQEIVANEQAELLLSLVSPEDQHILMLAFLQGFEREALAQKLGISAGATRVRLHRALKRLRLAWSEQHVKSQEGESNE